VTLEEIIDAIENDDPNELKILLTHYSQINEYFEIENGVLMTPLLYAIKMKSPDCVDILILNGADPSLSLKIQEKNGEERSLNTNALEYATGEKKKASGEDKINYEDIILIIKEKLNGSDDITASPSDVGNPDRLFGGSSEPILSPSQTASAHRVAQSTFQNQLAIKKLREENSSLKKEVQILKQEIERFRPWIERWIYESTPASTPLSPPITVMDSDNRLPPKKVKKKRVNRDGNGQVEPIKRSSSPKTSTDSRPKSVLVKSRSTEVEKIEKIEKKPKPSGLEKQEEPKPKRKGKPEQQDHEKKEEIKPKAKKSTTPKKKQE